MEIIVTIEAVGAYTERGINRTDGTTDCFKSRGLMLAHGAEKFYGELTGYSAVKYKETEFFHVFPRSASKYDPDRSGLNDDLFFSHRFTS